MTRTSTRLVLALILLLVPATESAHAQTPLDNAPVPSLCEFPAGTLVNGSLPGIPEGQGSVTLSARYTDGQIATGRIREDGDYAAVLSCNHGGVGWPDNVVLYGPDLQPFASTSLYDITHGGREGVQKITIANGRAVAQVVGIKQSGDADCCGTASATVTFGWNGSALTTTKTLYTERATATKLLKAIRRGSSKQARRYASASVVRQLRGLRSIRLRKCAGNLDDVWSALGVPEDTVRTCPITFKTRDGDEGGFYLNFEKPTWNTFKATSISSFG